jgi:CCR4-NOT transcription complex subunit 1
MLSPGTAEKAQRAFDAAAQANPRIRNIEQAPTESFAADIEEEANSYFQKIYTGQHSIDEIVDMLKRFSKSQVAR